MSWPVLSANLPCFFR